MNIRLAGVHFAYPGRVEALRGVDLAVEAGERVALIGENGAGKTTLARHLNGLLKPDRGDVWIGDWNTRDRTVGRLAARVGYAFQNPDDQLFARTVREEVAFGPRNLGRDAATVDQDVQQALAQVGLSAAVDSHPYDLQAAERKLIALAAVLAMRTPVVVLDEPTMGQDARGIERIGRIVDELAAAGRTVLTISHNIDFCAEHFRRVVVLSQGQVVVDGPVEAVLSQAATLNQAQVDPPQLVRLAQALDWPQAPLTVAGFLAAWRARAGES